MATIDYKELYEQALAKAQELSFDGYLDAVAVNDIFPELKESEDEKISKYLIRYFKANNEKLSSGFKWNGITVDECVAWLEKQGKTSPVLSNSSNIGKDEQKPAEWSEEDEKQLQHAMLALQWYAGGTDIIDWLKKLKDRVQPQSQWKPTKRQLLELSCAISGYSFDKPVLVELEENLKKLMEE